jgi:hypothetical protein
MTGQCKFDGIYFVFFSHPQKEERNPTHIAHIGKAPLTNASTNAFSTSAILPLHHCKFDNFEL